MQILSQMTRHDTDKKHGSMNFAKQETVLKAMYDAAVASAHPSRFLATALPRPPAKGRLVILAAGKAAGSMVQAAESHYLDVLKVDPDRILGLGVARIGYGASTRLVAMMEAGHPVPDAASVEAARRALALAGAATRDDLVLVLLSGGASANWVAPAGGMTLAEKQEITRALLRSGAVIGEINTVRRHLSRIKGGRLALAAAPARLVTLAISDVPGDDPSAIGSGPTVPDPTTLAEARAILARHRIALPLSAVAVLADPGQETPKPGHPAFGRNSYRILATPADAIAAAMRQAADAGYETIDLGADLEGEAREVAAAHARLALQLKAEGRKVALVSGGELTVTIRGRGKGGPNQEYALALAIALAGAPGIHAMAGDTDGTDGGAGAASDPAGAFVNPLTLAAARKKGMDADMALAENDSTGFFAAIDGLLTPGPTLTNVNDCRVILTEPT